jgi:hypothetical protein
VAVSERQAVATMAFEREASAADQEAAAVSQCMGGRRRGSKLRRARRTGSGGRRAGGQLHPGMVVWAQSMCM